MARNVGETRGEAVVPAGSASAIVRIDAAPRGTIHKLIAKESSSLNLSATLDLYNHDGVTTPVPNMELTRILPQQTVPGGGYLHWYDQQGYPYRNTVPARDDTGAPTSQESRRGFYMKVTLGSAPASDFKLAYAVTWVSDE